MNNAIFVLEYQYLDHLLKPTIRSVGLSLSRLYAKHIINIHASVACQVRLVSRTQLSYPHPRSNGSWTRNGNELDQKTERPRKKERKEGGRGQIDIPVWRSIKGIAHSFKILGTFSGKRWDRTKFALVYCVTPKKISFWGRIVPIEFTQPFFKIYWRGHGVKKERFISKFCHVIMSLVWKTSLFASFELGWKFDNPSIANGNAYSKTFGTDWLSEWCKFIHEFQFEFLHQWGSAP